MATSLHTNEVLLTHQKARADGTALRPAQPIVLFFHFSLRMIFPLALGAWFTLMKKNIIMWESDQIGSRVEEWAAVLDSL